MRGTGRGSGWRTAALVPGLLGVATAPGALVLLAGGLLPASLAAQGPPPAPLFAEEGAPLQRLGLTPMVEGADPVEAGGFRADLWLGYSNIFEQDSTASHNLYLDLERLVTALTLRYGVAHGVEVGARLTLESTWGGFLDPVVLGLHDALRLGSRNREFYPEGAYGQSLEVGGVTRVEVARSALALEDVRLFGKVRLAGGDQGPKALSLRAVARIPTRDNVVGRERRDVGIMLLGRMGWKRFHLHGMLGGSTVRRSPELRDLLNPAQLFLMAAAEYPFSDGFSGIVQFTASTQLLRGVGDRDVDGPPTNTILGVAWRDVGGWRIEAALQEDTPPWGPSLDFTLQLGVSRGW